MNRKFFTTNSTKALLILIVIAPAFAAQAQPQIQTHRPRPIRQSLQPGRRRSR